MLFSSQGVARTSPFLFGCAMVGVAAATARAGVIQVPSQHPTIQAAISAAQNGDTVLVADGTHSGTGNYNIDFQGKAITVQSANGPANCIINAQATPQSQRMVVYFHSGETSASVLSGFTITGGYAFNGAGIFLANGSSPTIRNCNIVANHANCWGGGLYYEYNCNPQIVDCIFKQNYSADDGGAIFGFGGSPTVTNTSMIGNISDYTGGAITSFGSGTLTISNCTIAQNSAYLGAAVYGWGVNIVNSVIWGNTGDDQQIVSGNNTVFVTYSTVQGGYSGRGNLAANPQFVDPSNGDFHLQPNSPAIDAGDPKTLVEIGAVDLDGDPRDFGSDIDMGIDEFRKTGDVTGDHQINVSDLLAVINGWGPCTINNADLNGDFLINVNDLLIVINHWGT